MINLLPDGLSPETILWALKNPEKTVAACVAALNERAGIVPVETEAFLTEVGTIPVPHIATFVAEQKFREGKKTNGVLIRELGEGFKRLLGIEKMDIAPATLRIKSPMKSVLGEVVHEEIGDTNIALAHFWEHLKLSKPDPASMVIAPCYDQFVFACWRVDRAGCFIDAVPVTNRRFRLEAGDRVAIY